MVKVAIAGGTAGVGRELVQAIVATNKHEVVVLSRSDDRGDLPSSVALKKVDYTNYKQLVEALQGVHTVMCTFYMVGTGIDGPNVKAQNALIKAASEVGAKRFVPSEYGSDPIGRKGEKAVVVDELEKHPDLEYILFVTGLFMDYLAGSRNSSYLKRLAVFVDPDKGQAIEVPGTGNEKLAFTKVGDVARFVAASLDLEKWPKVAGMVGERASYNEVIAKLEEIQGRKYDPVTYRTLHDMKSYSSRFDSLGILTVEGKFDCAPTLNELLPEVKPVGLDAYLRSVWKPSL